MKQSIICKRCKNVLNEKNEKISICINCKNKFESLCIDDDGQYYGWKYGQNFYDHKGPTQEDFYISALKKIISEELKIIENFKEKIDYSRVIKIKKMEEFLKNTGSEIKEFII